MSGFGWPQWVMLILYVVTAVHGSIKHARNTEITSNMATVNVFVTCGVTVFFAYVLHAGGFW